MADKQIKIAFAVDETSARKAKALIDDMTRAVDKLIASASRVSSALGSGGGGTSVGRKTLGYGSGGMSHVATPAGNKAGGSIISNILGDTGSMRGLATGAEQAFTKVTASIKTFVGQTNTELGKLQRTVDNLVTSMGKLGPVGGGGFGGHGGSAGGGGGGFGGGVPSVPGSPPPIPGGVKKSPSGQGPPPIPDMTAEAKYDPWRISHGSFKLAPGGGTGAMPQALGQLMRGDIQGFMSSGLGQFSGVGAAAYAGFKAGDAINGFMQNERAARVEYTLNQPFERMQRKAEMAQPFLMMHNAVNSRDAASMLAYNKALNRDDIKKSIGQVALRKETVEHALSTMTAAGAGKEIISQARNWASGKTGLTSDDFAGFINGIDPATLSETSKLNMIEIMRKKAEANLGPEAMKQLAGAMQNERTVMDPTTAMLVNEVYGNAMGRTKMMRAAGLSTGNVKMKGGGMGSRVEALQAKLMEGGWDMGDYTAGHQQLLGIGTGYSKAVSGIGLVSAGIGGLSNAAQLVQMGGTVGGSVAAGRAFYKGAQSSIGRGGLDVAVGRELFGQVGQNAMSSGQFGGAGATDVARMYAGLIGGGAGAPLDVGEQQRRASMVMQGNAAFGRFTSGAEAPLYQATSLMGAMGATGGYSLATEALTQMKPELLTQMARGGEVPRWAKSLGLGQDEASKFLEYNRKAPLFEVIDQLVPEGTQAAQTLSRVRTAEESGGDFMTVAKEEMAGVKKKKGESGKAYARRRALAAQNIAEDLGAAMYASHLTSSPEEGTGIFLGQMAQDKELAPYLKGKGVGAAAPTGAEKEALGKQAEVMAGHARTIAEKVDKLVTQLSPKAMEAGAEAGVAATRSLDESFSDTIDSASLALSNMSKAMKAWSKAHPSSGGAATGAVKASGR